MASKILPALALILGLVGCASHKEAQKPSAKAAVAQPLALKAVEPSTVIPWYPPLSGILDGATFVGQAERPESSVTFSFRQGYLHVLTKEKGLFAPYMALTSDTGTAFMAVTDGANNSYSRWKGVINGNNLEGTVTIFEKDKAPVEKTITATLQQPEPNSSTN